MRANCHGPLPSLAGAPWEDAHDPLPEAMTAASRLMYSILSGWGILSCEYVDQ